MTVLIQARTIKVQ